MIRRIITIYATGSKNTTNLHERSIYTITHREEILSLTRRCIIHTTRCIRYIRDCCFLCFVTAYVIPFFLSRVRAFVTSINRILRVSCIMFTGGARSKSWELKHSVSLVPTPFIAPSQAFRSSFLLLTLAMFGLKLQYGTHFQNRPIGNTVRQ